MPPQNVNFMYLKVVELEEFYLIFNMYFQINLLSVKKKLKIITFIIGNVFECMENIWGKI